MSFKSCSGYNQLTSSTMDKSFHKFVNLKVKDSSKSNGNVVKYRSKPLFNEEVEKSSILENFTNLYLLLDRP